MDANKRFWREFLEMYRALPCLWNFKCPDYSKRMAKNNAYKILAEKFKEIYPDANKQLVLRKINIIRTCYRREARKVRESENAGAAGKEIYVPNLWYFDLMSFLEDQDKEESGEKIVHEFQMIDDESASGGDKNKFIQEMEFSYPQCKIERGEPKCQEPHRLQGEIIHQQRKEKQEQQQRVSELFQRQPNKQPQQPMPRPSITTTLGAITDDETAALCSTWGIFYRDLDPRQKLFANKAINEVLYQGALGKLHEYSYKAIEDYQPIAMNKDENCLGITIDRVNYNDPEYLERFRHIDNIRDALKYLKPLEEYAMRENHAAVGLISQLEDTLRNWTEDSDNY